MSEATIFLLRLLVWLLPGVLSFLALKAFLQRRPRVGFGLLIAALVFTAFVKPWGLGLLSLGLGALVALGPRRRTAGKWLEDAALLRGKNREP
jgi:hypothetical protein